MNKFEQVSSDGHQMSLTAGQGQGLGPMSYVQWDRVRAGGQYSEVQCIMGTGHIRSPSVNDGQTQLKDYLPATSLAGFKNWLHAVSI